MRRALSGRYAVACALCAELYTALPLCTVPGCASCVCIRCSDLAGRCAECVLLAALDELDRAADVAALIGVLLP